MTASRPPILARIRDKLAALAAAAESVAEPEAAPPVRQHLFGSQCRVRMSFDDLMRTRGHTGEQMLAQRRRLVASSDTERQRDAATARAGYRPGEVVWPSE
jgi:hypothetical protein